MRLRKVVLVTFLALAVPVGAASLAHACTALATLTVSGGAAPGATINGTGKGFNGGGHGTPAGSTPVELRWGSRAGPIVATAAPANAAGDITFSFAAPNVPAGSYVLIGVQTNPATGTPFYGTPARQSVNILPAASRADASRGEGSAVSATVSDAPATAAPQAAGATTAAPAATPASQSGPAAPATAGRTAAASTAAPAQAGQASAGVGTATAGAPTSGGPGDVAPVGVGVAAASALSASPADGAVVTTTPGLVSSSSADQGSLLPAILLMVLGLGLGLAAAARWLSGRLPLLRNRSQTAAV